LHPVSDVNTEESSAVEIRRIAARDTTALRDAVLRPHLPPGSSIYPGDNAADTLHLGAFEKHRLIAVATVCREPLPGEQSTTSWRLRGMAALPEYRGHGIGKDLAQRCIAYAAEHGGTILWCTSRIATAHFYRKLGFFESGGTFTLPQHSNALYVRMVRALS
jgi:GNAT superfamily N-acetyltransferase